MDNLSVGYQVLIVIVASLISGIGSVIISNIYHKRADMRNMKFRTLQNLFGYKYQLNSKTGLRNEFAKTLNEIPVVFYKSKKVIKAHKDLYESIANLKDEDVMNEYFIILYKSMSQDLNLKIEKNINDEDFLQVMN